MYRRLSISGLALVLLAGIVPSTAMAADSAADSKYSYRPYGQQNQAGSDAENSPANSSGRAPAEPSYAPSGNGGAQVAAPTYRDDARRAPPPSQIDESDRGDRDTQGDAYKPPSRPLPPPTGESRRLQNTPQAACSKQRPARRTAAFPMTCASGMRAAPPSRLGAAKPPRVSGPNSRSGDWPIAGTWIACATAATMPSAPFAACRHAATRSSMAAILMIAINRPEAMSFRRYVRGVRSTV